MAAKHIPAHCTNANGLNQRVLCFRCLRAQKVCLCHLVHPIETHTHFVFLVHPKELRDRSGTATARLTHLCLGNSSLFVGTEFGDHTNIQSMLGDPQLACWLLFPGATAADLATIQGKQEFDDQSKDKTPVVFVLDGSWPCARKLLRLNPQLADLPHVSFSSAKVSQYRFRRQPHKHCVSTIEAVAEVIALVDQRPNEGVETPESGDDLNRGHSSQGPRILRSLLEELTRVQEQYPKRERI